LRAGGKIAHRVGRARRDRMGLRCGSRRTAKPAVGAAERRLRHRRDRLAGRLVAHLALGEDQRALARALVDDFEDALLADDGVLSLERLMQAHALLAVDDAHPVDAGIAVAHPESWMAEHGA